MSNRADTFDRADSSTSIGTPSDAAGAYAITAGVFGIRSNQGYLVSGSDGDAVLECLSGVVQVDLKVTGTLIGISLNCSDASNKYNLYYNTDTAIKLDKVVAGTRTNIVTLTGPSVSGTQPTIGLKRRADGTTLDVLVNGTVVNTQTAQTFNNTVTRHGIWGFGAGAGLNADNLVITDQAPALAAGTLSTNGTVTPTSVPLKVATNTGGTSPYSNQLQRSPTGAGTWSNVGTSVSGAAPTFTDSTASAGTTYDYRVVVTDSAGSPAAVNSNTLTVAVPNAATSFAFSGPTGGTAGVASGNFTVTPNGFVTSATVTIGISGAAGGTTSAATLTFTGSSAAQTFTYTPASAGTETITLAVTAGAPSTVSPNSKTYASAVKNFVLFIGDSWTYGTNASAGQGTTGPPVYPGNVMSALGGANWSGTNAGVAGLKITDWMAGTNGALTPSAVDALYNSSRQFNIACVFLGINDLGGGTSAATAFANLKGYCQARRSAGWKVVVGTIPSVDYSGTVIDSQRDSFNALVKGDSSFYDALADWGASYHMGADGSYSNTTYYAAGGLHPVDPGYLEGSALFIGAIQSITSPAPVSGGGLVSQRHMLGGLA